MDQSHQIKDRLSTLKPGLQMQAPNKIQTVSELTRLLRHGIESAVPSCWVQGELSNFVRAASGHSYFIVKDSMAQIRCALFRGANLQKKINLEDGLQVEMLVRPTVYPARGDLQLIVEDIRLGGEGQLFKAFVELKLKLQNEGLFEKKSKKQIPVFPVAVGIVTSEKGAAIRDVISVLRKRMPSIRVILFPTVVQGKESGEKITQAFQAATMWKDLDVIILCRGGGSLEDLWGFNSEELARAVYSCPIPVVSGVGHETDFTIIDFVADHRAATPTGAAITVSPDRFNLMADLETINKNLQRGFKGLIDRQAQGLDYLSRRLVAPADRVIRQTEKIKGLMYRLSSSYRKVIYVAQSRLKIQAVSLRAQKKFSNSSRTVLEVVYRDLIAQVQYVFNQKERALDSLEHRATKFDVGAIFSRGFSIVEKMDGQVISAWSQVSPGESVKIKFAKGAARASIIEVDKKTKT